MNKRDIKLGLIWGKNQTVLVCFLCASFETRRKFGGFCVKTLYDGGNSITNTSKTAIALKTQYSHSKLSCFCCNKCVLHINNANKVLWGTKNVLISLLTLVRAEAHENAAQENDCDTGNHAADNSYTGNHAANNSKTWNHVAQSSGDGRCRPNTPRFNWVHCNINNHRFKHGVYFVTIRHPRASYAMIFKGFCQNVGNVCHNIFNYAW